MIAGIVRPGTPRCDSIFTPDGGLASWSARVVVSVDNVLEV